MMNDAPDSRLETLDHRLCLKGLTNRSHREQPEDDFLDFLVLTHSREGQPTYCMKLINMYDVEVSISAWVSHVVPLRNFIHFEN